MTNFVFLQMEISGNVEDVSTFAILHFSNGQFDFNTFKQMPLALKNTTAPAQPPIFRLAKPDNTGTRPQQVRAHKQWMKAKMQHDKDATAWQVNSKKLKKQYGHDNWYDWSVENWGTKWDASGGTMNMPFDGLIECTFKTAYSLPFPIFKLMAEMYPTLSFTIETVEDNGAFGGVVRIENGMINDSTTRDQWSEYAEKILGWVADEVEADVEDQVRHAIARLKKDNGHGGILNEMANYIKANLNDFLKYIK